MNEEINLSFEDHEQAKKEVAFLLDVLSRTIPELVGDAAETVGVLAGRAAAKKMPSYFESKDIGTVVKGVENFLRGGFDISCRNDNGRLTFQFGRCALREVCGINNVPLGGDLCQYFHSYLKGMIAEHSQKKFDVKKMEAGVNSCHIEYTVTGDE